MGELEGDEPGEIEGVGDGVGEGNGALSGAGFAIPYTVNAGRVVFWNRAEVKGDQLYPVESVCCDTAKMLNEPTVGVDGEAD